MNPELFIQFRETVNKWAVMSEEYKNKSEVLRRRLVNIALISRSSALYLQGKNPVLRVKLI